MTSPPPKGINAPSGRSNTVLSTEYSVLSIPLSLVRQIHLGRLQHFLAAVVLDEGDHLQVLQFQRALVVKEALLLGIIGQVIAERLAQLRDAHTEIVLARLFLQSDAFNPARQATHHVMVHTLAVA